jgi:hypothetical protein|nr:hypothetical protein [Mycolicibacterium vulneris]
MRRPDAVQHHDIGVTIGVDVAQAQIDPVGPGELLHCGEFALLP